VDEAVQGGQVVGVDAGHPGVEVLATAFGEQASEPAFVIGVHPVAGPATLRARHRRDRRPRDHPHHRLLVEDLLNDQRRQPREHRLDYITPGP